MHNSLADEPHDLSGLLARDRWNAVLPVLDAVLDLEPSTRAAYLDEACAGDPRLREDVERALRGCEQTAYVLSRPLSDVFAGLVAGLALQPAQPGERIGPYAIVRPMGQGGMGTVYLAERADAQYESRVALKLVNPGLEDPTFLRRFLDERQILATLGHPHIARLYDGGVTESGRPWFAMELVDGAPIDVYCDSRRLTTRERLRLLLDVCDAVQYAHDNGIIHRDVKPSNILVDAEGRAKLVDFGIAKAMTSGNAPQTKTLYRVLTPQYASPEQIRGDAVSVASDVYSLAVVLYELLTGCRLYRPADDTAHALLTAILEQDPEGPSDAATRATDEQLVARHTTRPALRRQLRGDLDTILLMALRKEPERRYATVEQFAGDLRRFLDGMPVTAQRDTLVYRARKLARRRRAAVLGTLGAVTLAAGAVTMQRWLAPRADSAPPGVIMRQVTFRGDVSDGAVSRDGRWLAYAVSNDSAREVHVQDLANGVSNRITTGANKYMFLHWSPDASRLAVSEYYPGVTTSTALYPRAGGEPVRRLWFHNVQWTRAGNQYFQFAPNWRTPTFFRWDQDTRSAVHLKHWLESLQDAVEHPLGGLLAIAMWSERGDSSAIWTVAFDTKPQHTGFHADSTRTQQRLVVERGTIGFNSLQWSPRGDWLYYIRQIGEEQSLRRIPVGRTFGAEGPPETVVTGLEWSWRLTGTDDDRLFYVKGRLVSNIWLGRRQGERWAFRPLTTGTFLRRWPRLSPDGRRVAFELRGNIHLADTDGGGEQQLTNTGTVVGEPAWSPHGGHLAFAVRGEGAPRLALLRNDSLHVMQQIEVSEMLTWTPDGRVLCREVTRRNYQLVDPETGDNGLLLPADSARRGWVFDARVSPDGHRVAFKWIRTQPRSSGVYLFDLRSRAFRRLAPGTEITILGWSEDGRIVRALDVSARRLVDLPVSGEPPRERGNLAVEATNGSVAAGVLALEVTRHEGDVWMIERGQAGRAR
jgi:serine/threonine protein kinase/Tol biopolymer transport system component